MAPDELELAYPMGDPGAVKCRGCGAGKRRHGVALMCPVCDMGTEPLD